MATTVATESSFMSVASDLVTERNVFWKLMLGCIYLTQLSANVAIMAIYGTSLETRTFEFIFTVTFLCGGLLATSVVNIVSYFSKSRLESKLTVEKDTTAEANSKEWVIAKVMCSVLPLCPIIRYIESTRASGKLLSLEQRLISEQRDGNFTGKKSTFSTTKSQKSAASKLSDGIGLMEDNIQKQIRRQRRYFRRCERQAALVALFHAVIVAGPQIFFQLYFLLRQDVLQKQSIFYSSNEVKCIVFVVVISVFWLALALTQFYPARRVTHDPDGERSIQIRFLGMTCIFLWHLFMVSGRILAFCLFTQCYHLWVIVIIGAHWLITIGTFIIYRRLAPGFSSATQFTASSMAENTMFDLFYSWVSIFDFINANQGKTRMRYLIYYLLFYTENIILIMAWYSSNCVSSNTWYKIPSLFSVLFTFFLGFIFMQVYYLYLHSDNSLSVWTLCRRLFSMEDRRQNYMGPIISVVDPVTGQVGPSQPFWQNRDDVFRAPSAALAPSVYSFSAASHAHSFASSDNSAAPPYYPMGASGHRPIKERPEVQDSDVANLSSLDDIIEGDTTPAAAPPPVAAKPPKPSTLRNTNEPPKPKPKPRFQKSQEDLSGTPPDKSRSSSVSSATRNIPQKETDF